MGEAQATVTMMGGAIAALFGFIVWLYRSTLERADKRIATLEERETNALAALTKYVESIESMTRSLVDGFREVRLALMDVRERSDRGRGGGGG